MNTALTNQTAALLRRTATRHCFKPSSSTSLRLSSSFSSPRLPAFLPTRFSQSRVPTSSKRAFSVTPATLFSATPVTMGGLETINSQEDFQAKIAQGVVVVDCFAEWCGPCKAIAPKVEEFSKIYSGAKFYQLDVDEQANVAAEVGVRAMPTFIIYKNGEEFEKVVGANPGALEAKIQEALA